jgi:predicted DCC family thiol-disulfide oxidoreductase YuxK
MSDAHSGKLIVNQPPESVPLMLYDATCDFCCRWISRWRIITGDSIGYIPLQSASDRFPELPMTRLQRAVHLVDLDGHVFSGAEAVFRTLARSSRPNRWLLWTYHHIPSARRIIDRVYAWVARNRFHG